MKIQPSLCLDDWGKPRKNLSQVGRHWNLNPEPPECESRALPRSHLARFFFFSLRNYNTYLSIFSTQLLSFLNLRCNKINLRSLIHYSIDFFPVINYKIHWIFLIHNSIVFRLVLRTTEMCWRSLIHHSIIDYFLSLRNY